MPRRPKLVYSTPPKRVARMEDLSAEALRCHAWLHPWDSPPAIPFKWCGYLDALLLLFRCPSCGTERRDVRYQNNRGSGGKHKLITRLYRHPDLYLVAFPARQPDYIEEWFERFELPPDDVSAEKLAEWGALRWAEAKAS